MQPLGNFSCLYSRLQQLKHIQPTFVRTSYGKITKNYRRNNTNRLLCHIIYLFH